MCFSRCFPIWKAMIFPLLVDGHDDELQKFSADVVLVLVIPNVNLVGGLEHDFYFPIYWEFHHPN